VQVELEEHSRHLARVVLHQVQVLLRVLAADIKAMGGHEEQEYPPVTGPQAKHSGLNVLQS
jgi:hypothetical protein